MRLEITMKIILFAICAVLVAAPIDAQDKKMPPSAPRPTADATVEEPLPRAVKIAFRFEPVEPTDKPLWVVVATPRYTVEVNYETKEIEAQIRVDGKVRVVDGGQLLVSYNAQVRFSNADGGAFFSSEGSARLTPGKEKMLTTVGERGLMVLATYDDAEK